MSHFDWGNPCRRFDRQRRREYLHYMIDQILDLEAATSPYGGDSTAERKDQRAFEALQETAAVVHGLAGWAIDHQIGLALNGYAFLPLGPQHIRELPAFKDEKAAVDDHKHERDAAALHRSRVAANPGDFRPATLRQMLVNLLRANPGAIPDWLAQHTIDALEALEYGETPGLLEPAPTDLRGQAYSRLHLQLMALCHVEYLHHAYGMQKVRARGSVADAYGCDTETVRKWAAKVRRELGDVQVTRQLTFAKNAARSDAAQGVGETGDFDRRSLGDSYRRAAMKRNGELYQNLRGSGLGAPGA